MQSHLETLILGISQGDTFVERGSVANAIKISATPGGAGVQIYQGAQTTRDTVRAEVGTAGAIGSVYLSTAGKMYLKVANADATGDWAKVTTSAAD